MPDTSIPTAIAGTRHDHSRCISTAMTTARSLCAQKGVRLTALREQVLHLIWQSHKPLGAYELMEQLARETTRRVAPPTVYRALEFLLEQGLVHRINSLNAYVGCTHPRQEHATNFLICRHCGVAIEFASVPLESSLQASADELGFIIEAHSIEVVGSCKRCADLGGTSHEH